MGFSLITIIGKMKEILFNQEQEEEPPSEIYVEDGVLKENRK
jgi:hypothetical protein